MSENLFKRTGEGDFDKYLKVLVSGPPKSGKTTLLGTVPNILVLDTEPFANNLESIRHLNLPYATITSTDDLHYAASVLSSDSLRQQLAQQRYGLQDIEAVAIDTMDTLQKIMKAERLKEQRSTTFQRDDWGWLKTEMEAIIQKFTALPMHVFFMVHTKTQEVGKGDDAYQTVMPGLEGAIAGSIAGMVGYSLLSFRKEEIDPVKGRYTKYWLQTEGDRTYDFLGTRTAGRLPTIIEPDMKTIYETVMANRPAMAAAPPPIPAAPTGPPAGLTVPGQVPGQEVAQVPIQDPAVQTPVETPAPPAPTAAAPAAAPAAERPDNDSPVTPAAMQHVKRVYDAVGVAFPEDIVSALSMGTARQLVSYYQAVIADHRDHPELTTDPKQEMLDILVSNGWLVVDAPAAAPPAPTAEPKIDGTVEQVMAYVDGDLGKVQAAYDLESAKGGDARKTLISRLEGLGAKPPVAVQVGDVPAPVADAPEAPAEVQTPVETPAEAPAEAVTPEAPVADTPVTEDEAVQTAQSALGAEVVSQAPRELTGDDVCDVCGNKIDDLDLARLGQKRFDGKVLCVNDYLAEGKK